MIKIIESTVLELYSYTYNKLYNKENIFESQHLKNLGPDALNLKFSVNYFLKHQKITSIKMKKGIQLKVKK